VYGSVLMALVVQLRPFYSKTIGLVVTSHMPFKSSTPIVATIEIQSNVQAITHVKLGDGWLNWALSMVYKKLWFWVDLLGVWFGVYGFGYMVLGVWL